jgi:DNA-binding transcriptional ArsR family regulator
MASITSKAEGPQTDPQGSTGSSDGESCLEYSADEGRVDRARKAELRPDVLRDMADTFKVLSHPTRLRILRALAEEELCVCELSELLRLSMSATSHQLRKLRDRRLVDYRTVGRFAYYRLSDPFLISVLAFGVDQMNGEPVSP